MKQNRPRTPVWQSAWIDSPIGPVGIAGGPGGILRITLGVARETGMARLAEEFGDGCVGGVTDWVDACRRQIEEYFLGKRTAFGAKVDLHGTLFQENVWRAIKRIPFGRVRTYGEVARMAGRESAFRAVGQAAGANPVPLLIPCHRVVAAGGALGGFGSGLDVKRWLLEFEMNQRRSGQRA